MRLVTPWRILLSKTISSAVVCGQVGFLFERYMWIAELEDRLLWSCYTLIYVELIFSITHNNCEHLAIDFNVERVNLAQHNEMFGFKNAISLFKHLDSIFCIR